MRRLLLLLAATAFLTLSAVPSANAAHMGPCSHEYAEAALGFVFDHGAKNLGQAVGGCIDGTVWWLCYGYPWFSCVLS
jgi:hypothetical protein